MDRPIDQHHHARAARQQRRPGVRRCLLLGRHGVPAIAVLMIVGHLCGCGSPEKESDGRKNQVSGLERLLSGEGQVSVNGSQPASMAIETVVENPDGSTTLLTPTPAHVIAHTRKCLYDLNYDLLLEQLIAQETKKTYTDRGLDLQECADWFSDNLRDVLLVLNRMSGGMSSPNVVSKQSGKYLEMRIYGRAAEGMRFTTVEMTQEMGQFKLLLIH
ncbi:MAG: hypothetical protein HND57_00055 [Planctomycetes bacterium]|nr:hypothetical protein [Planctomycetota bacterium]